MVNRMVVSREKEHNRDMEMERIELPAPLLQKVKEAAAKEDITPEELVRDAVEVRLSRTEWAKTLEFGARNARERGITTEDIDKEIAANRSERSR
jgi:hypothetical protein